MVLAADPAADPTADAAPSRPAGRRSVPGAFGVELAVALLFTLWVAWPFVRPGAYLAGFDSFAYAGPNLKITLDAARDARLPFWNDTIFGGIPHLANPSAASLYPLKLLALPFDTARGIGGLTALHLFLLATGVVWLAHRTLRLAPPAGALAAVLTVGSGAYLVKSLQFEQILVLAWVPWALVLVETVLRSARPQRPAAMLGVVVALMVLAGHPQMVYVCAPLLVVWSVARSLDHRSPRRLALVAAAALAGGLLAAVQLLPTAELSSRAAFREGRTLASVADPAYSADPARLNENVLGDVTKARQFVFLGGDFESVAVVGAAAFSLACLGAVHGVRRRRRRFTALGLAAVALVAASLAVGPRWFPYRWAFEVVPGWDQARVPARWMVVAVTAVVLLAALGVDALMSRQVTRRDALAAGGTGLALVAVVAAGPAPFPTSQRLLLWGLAAAAVALAGATVALGRQRQVATVAAGGLLAAAVAFEILPVAHFSVARTSIQPVSFTGWVGPAVERLVAEDDGKVFPGTYDRWDDPRYLVAQLRPNANGLFGIRSIDGYDGGVQITQRWVDAISGLANDPVNPALTLRAQGRAPLSPEHYARLGVRWALLDTEIVPGEQLAPAWGEPVLTDGTVRLYENPAYRGEATAWFATAPQAGGREIARRLREEAGGPLRDVALVEPDGPVLACDAGAAACAARRLDLVRPHPGRVEVSATVERPALVAVAEQFDPGWRAWVDGRPVEPVVVDGFATGVPVAAGAHRIVFDYRPPGFTAALAVSLAGLAGVLALALWRPRRRAVTAGDADPAASVGQPMTATDHTAVAETAAGTVDEPVADTGPGSSTVARTDDGLGYLVAPRRTVVQHIGDVWRYRELLKQLVRKELKVKYRNSTLGFLWSLLNPAFMVLIYTFVFNVVFRSNISRFPIWLLTGLLLWNFFSASLAGATGSITNNAYLVGKVRFPREILPLASIGAALVHFFLQLVVLTGALALFRHHVAWGFTPLLPLALVTLIVFCAGMSLLLSAVNVYARDTQHLLELALTAWFYLTPVLYPYMFVASRLADWGVPTNLALVNPMTAPVMAFQRALYGAESSGANGAAGTQMLPPDASIWWYARNLAIVLAVSSVVLAVAIKVFDKAEGNFAEVM